MNFRGQRKNRRVEATLELTPLIDVIFLLLIFFVMTTTPAMTTAERLDVDLPEAASGEAAEQEEQRVTLRVLATGEVYFRYSGEEEERLVQDLRTELGALYEENPQIPIWIRGDVEASHGAVISLLDTARDVGFRRVHMAVRPGR